MKLTLSTITLAVNKAAQQGNDAHLDINNPRTRRLRGRIALIAHINAGYALGQIHKQWGGSGHSNQAMNTIYKSQLKVMSESVSEREVVYRILHKLGVDGWGIRAAVKAYQEGKEFDPKKPERPAYGPGRENIWLGNWARSTRRSR